TMFVRLADWSERGKKLSADELSKKLTMALAGAIEDAQVFLIAPPAVPGLGTGNGFTMMIEDKSGAGGYKALEGATFAMMGAAAQSKQVSQVFSLFNTGSPRVRADIDRDRAQLLGVQPS